MVDFLIKKLLDSYCLHSGLKARHLTSVLLSHWLQRRDKLTSSGQGRLISEHWERAYEALRPVNYNIIFGSHTSGIIISQCNHKSRGHRAPGDTSEEMTLPPALTHWWCLEVHRLVTRLSHLVLGLCSAAVGSLRLTKICRHPHQ